MTDVVAVEHVCVHGSMKQLTLKRLGDSRFSCTGETSEPNDRSAMAAPRRARSSRNFSFAPKNVFALCNLSIGVDAAENRTASADLSVVNENKSAEIRNMIVIVNHERTAGLNR